ncbi:vitamin K epoxide reductase family protein [Mucilaginibacter panaciglaebae]|uniref:Peptidase C39 domain-containing protein n=1 Tax=Mucilaginibacter panaciglaebae TaxID=502331 RepID=A0ABP7X2W2_9SPHI
MERSNITAVLNFVISELQIPVTRQGIDDEIAKHPDYRSLLAVSEVLTNWNIPNAAYPLSFEELIDADVPTPFIAHLSNSGGEFVLVSKFDDKQVVVSNEHWRKHRLSINEFKLQYNGAILIAEKQENSGEPDYKRKHRKQVVDNIRIPFVITSIVVLLILSLLSHSVFSTVNWPTILLALLKTAGLVTSIMLLIQSIDINNPLIQKLCGGDNNRDCNAILSSKDAKISDELSWSEIGFFYFAGTWLVLLLNNGHNSLMQMLVLLNIVSLPYTFYSIYYQWRVAKQWCIFCCTVQALLWLEFFAFVPYIKLPIQVPSLREWTSLLTGMALPILAWIFIKPYFLKGKQIKPLKWQLRKFKYNVNLFNKLLNEQLKYALPDEKYSLIIGNREAEHVITMVSNPYCQPCSAMHKKLDNWLRNRNDIKLQVVFNINTIDEKDPKSAIASHLLSLRSDQNDFSLKKALDDWYEQKQKSYEAWADKHPVEEQIINIEALEAQSAWCKLADITSTPTVFINGRRIPDNYHPEDIKYFI